MPFWFTTKKIGLNVVHWNIDHCTIEGTFMIYLFNSPGHLKRFHSYLNSYHLNISSTIENEKDNITSFLDVNIIREQALLHTLLYRCFRICSDWTKFHLELVKLIDVFKNNGYPENFINNCFKVFLDNKYRIQEKVITVPKKTLVLVFPYLGPLSLQTTTKLRKSVKGILNCCRLQIVFKSQNKLAKALKIVFLKNLHLVSFINFSVDSAMNPIMANASDTLM